MDRKQCLHRARDWIHDPPKAFATDMDCLEAARIRHELRALLSTSKGRASKNQKTYDRLDEVFAAVLKKSPDLILQKLSSEHHLEPVEFDILITLTLSALDMVDDISDRRDLLDALQVDGPDRLKALKTLRSEGKLVKAGLIDIDESSDDLSGDTTPKLSLSQRIKDQLVDGDDEPVEAIVASHEELLQQCHPLFQALRDRADALNHEYSYGGHRNEIARKTYKVDRLYRQYCLLASAHKDWPLPQLLFSQAYTAKDFYFIFVLLGKELGFCSPDTDLFNGESLAMASSRHIGELKGGYHHLRRDHRLRADNVIQVCGGENAGIAQEDDATLKTIEFELTREFLAKLSLKKQKHFSSRSREPLLSLSQLVLSSDVKQALDLALIQLRKSKVFLDEWGLGKTIAYGRGVTILFYGPPGTGKTASAEGLAKECGKALLVADYSQIQNCFVGQTEKNIVRVFRNAIEDDAVLFWDECDAMFYDRESAQYSWEARDINILLQQIERFPGLCILSTNRQGILDKALERR